MIVGVVLAGGKSSRFGAPKALAMLQGRTLAEHAVKQLETVASLTALNAPPGSETAAFARERAWLLVSDAPYDPPGPLAGIRAALAWGAAQNATMVATTPCDAPLMPGNLFPRLVAEIGETPVACARTPEGVHPLASVWRPEALALVEAALARGKYPPLTTLMAAWGAKFVDFPDDTAFANLNTPVDLAAAEAALFARG